MPTNHKTDFSQTLKKAHMKWKKFLFLSKVSDFEKSSKKSWQKKTTDQSWLDFEAAIAKESCFVLGDHRLNPLQTKSWLDRVGKKLNSKWTFVTDRFDTEQVVQVKAFLAGDLSIAGLCKFLEISKPYLSCPEGGVVMVLSMLKRKKIAVTFVNPRGSFMDQTKRLYKSVAKQRKNGPVIAWTGSLKVSPAWKKLWPKSFVENPPMMINVDGEKFQTRSSIPWQVSSNDWQLTQASPFLNLEVTRLWQASMKKFVPPNQIRQTIVENIKYFSKQFGQKQVLDFTVLHPFGFVEEIDFRKLHKRPREFVLARLNHLESAVVPSADLILINQLDPGSIAEESMHYFRLCKMKKQEYGPWVTIWEEAWGMFGSLMIDPTREIPNPKNLEVWEDVHLMGYQIGKAIFEKWKKKKNHKLIKEIFAWQTLSEKKAQDFVEKVQILLWSEGF